MAGKDERSEVEIVWAHKKKCTNAPVKRCERLAVAGVRSGRGRS